MKVVFVPKQGRKEQWEIFVEGERWKDVHRTIFGAKPLFPPVVSGALQSIFDEYEYRRVKQYVLWRLSKQSYHSEHLSRLLSERLVQQKTRDRVLKEFQDAGYLDDDAWLKAFLNSQKKKCGLHLILSKLRKKGFSSHTLQKISENWADEADDLQAIGHLLNTRYRLKDLKDYKIRQRVFAALVRKGFSFENIREAFSILTQFSDDFFADGRQDTPPQKRKLF